MTIRLTVRTAPWRSHVARLASEIEGLVPVVKGNGYGFGRVWLAGVAAEFADTIAVGTVHELDGLPDGPDVVVLTPTLVAPPTTAPILTVGRAEHIAALAGWNGRVIVKLESAMRRFGGTADIVGEARAAGLEVLGVSVHPPLAGTPRMHRADIERVLDDIDPAIPAWLSHLDPDAFRSLPAGREYRLRLGTLLWHGDKSTLHLRADALDVRPVAAGDVAGYRLGEIPGDGHLVMVGAGTANGVAALADGRSPFHFGHARMPLHEPPHMHTSMVFVEAGAPCPAVGDWVDLQRPLHMTTVDEYDWI